jgi:general secretion pathway protein J
MKKNNSRSRRFQFFQSGYKNRGFTLLEILIALFIFTLISLILAGALRGVINSLTGTENKAERLRKLQIALLVMSRDIEETVNRPIINHEGKKDPAFVGTEHGFTFTHTGVANAMSTSAHSTLERAGYAWSDNKLYKITWAVLDQAPKSQPSSRILLSNVLEAHFEYADQKGRFYKEWPLNGEGSDPLPRGIRLYLTIAGWGTMTALYLIPVEVPKVIELPGQPAKPQETPKTQSSSGKIT